LLVLCLSFDLLEVAGALALIKEGLRRAVQA